jgi:charged multivesicular body protein 5
MNRLFGKKKAAPPPPPTLGEASQSIGTRLTSVDAKIASLDQELLKFKNQLKQTPAGPAQNGIKKRAMETLKRKKMYVVVCVELKRFG